MFRDFLRSTAGNMSLVMGIAIIPLAMSVGVAIDYMRANALEARLQSYADSAVLAAANSSAMTDAELTSEARRYFIANANRLALDAIPEIAVTQTAEGLKADVQTTIPASLLTIAGIMNLPVNVTSTVDRASGGNLEVALVLDNTGSMAGEMGNLRSASQLFVDTVMPANNLSLGNPVKIAVVPYVATVNIGNDASHMAWMDTTADSQHHARWMEWSWYGTRVGCTPPPGGGGGDPDPGAGGDDDAMLMSPKDILIELAALPFGLIGITTANAAEIHGDASLPSGFWWDDYWCGIYSPKKLNHFNLLNDIPGAQWKGCVEARPEPYDVQDDPPVAAVPNTRFVPYFWPDEVDKFAGWVPDAHNNYMSDAPYLDPALTVSPQQSDSWSRNYSILKYTGSNAATIDETGPVTSGPNASCPDPVLPLTATKAGITAKIAGLTHWMGGGTITSEGIAWGWRVLSPSAPFTEGSTDPKVKKIMVVMTDGRNDVAGNQMVSGGYADSPMISDYSAYGYMRWGRFPTPTFAAAHSYLNQRMAQVCSNAKSDGIIIYTVGFGSLDTSTEMALQDCKSPEGGYFHAANAAELSVAFKAVAASIAKLRIVK